jgi:CDP-4-dehydro-6-deoxyglucose reductase, E1
MDAIMKIARQNKLFVIEDNADAMGSSYKGKKTGTFGNLATESFYPAHHMTTAGEGGAVVINDGRFLRIIQSLRDWGRACWCGAAGGGLDGACGVRFKYKIDGAPYDHKYIFSHIGYNLKPVEIQAAMGRIQLQKLPDFIRKRKANFQKYYHFFQTYDKYFILPKALPESDPSWFSFPLTIRENSPFDRLKLTMYLEDNLIQTRPLFAGNILRQPAFKNVDCRVIGDLKYSDLVFFNTFFIGVYPGITDQHLDYIFSKFNTFLKKY